MKKPESCKICNSDVVIIHLTDIDLYQCSRCGLISDHILHDEKYLSGIYEKLYKGPKYNGHIKEHEMLKVGKQPPLGWHKKAALKWIQENKTAQKSAEIFEFGAGVGLVAEYLKKDSTIHYSGIEMDSYAAGLAQERGCNVKNKSITAHFDESSLYDYVISFEVVEHISDLKVALDNIFKLLKKDGYLLFSVPNFLRYKNHTDQKLHQDMPPVHINFFTPENVVQLGKYLNKNVIKVMERPYPYLRSPKIQWIKALTGSYHGANLVVIMQNN